MAEEKKPRIPRVPYKDPRKERTDYNKDVGKVIAVVSGKGGVGKSLVTSMLAVESERRGFKTGIMDLDITGPSIPKSFGLHGRLTVDGKGEALIPAETRTGIKVVSMNLLVNEEQPVIWRGPIISGTVGDFWNKTQWGQIDYLFADCPPGTGDVPLTLFQTVPVAGVVVVTSPQDLVSIIVEKAVNMAKMMNVPILGIVENMSYFTCPHCGEKLNVFGESHVDEIAEKNGVGATAKLPIDPNVAKTVDSGNVETLDTSGLKEVSDLIFGEKGKA